MINTNLLFIKIHYSLFYAGFLPIMIFGPTIARQRGYSASVVGVIYTTIAGISMLASILYGWIADKFKIKRYLFLFAIFMGLISSVMLMFAPEPHTKQKDVNTICNNATNNVQICQHNVQDIVNQFKNDIKEDTTCKFICDGNNDLIEEMCSDWGIGEYCKNETLETFNSTLDTRVSDFLISYTAIISPTTMLTADSKGCIMIDVGQIKDGENSYTGVCKNDIQTSCKVECGGHLLGELFDEPRGNILMEYSFWMFFIPLAILSINACANISVTDVICLDILKNDSRLFGRQRLYGTLSNGLAAVAGGFLVDVWSGGSLIKDYFPLFVMCASLFFIDLIVSSKLKVDQNEKCEDMIKSIEKTFNLQISIFGIFVLFIGICTSLNFHYLFWHLENLANDEEKKYIKLLQGLSMLSNAFGELPFFIFSDRILRGKHTRGMALALGAIGIQFISYSCLVRPVWVLPIGILCGLVNGVMSCTIALYARAIAPDGLETYMQGFFYSFHFLGVSSCTLTGFLFEKYKGLAFGMIGVASLLFLFIFLLSKNYVYPSNNENHIGNSSTLKRDEESVMLK